MSAIPKKDERQQAGKAERKQCPRAQHAQWKRSNGKRDALAILHRAETDRLPHLLAIKHERMAASPFGYFRGAVPVMAFDFGQLPRTGILCQLCGDAHVRNLGAYAGVDGRLTFDINDFDESLRGPFEWDVKRLATSIHLAAREAQASEASCGAAVHVFLRRYRKSLGRFAAMPVLELGRYQVHRASELAAIAAVFSAAERATPLKLRDKLTEPASRKKERGKAGGGSGRRGERPRVLRTDPPLLTRLPETEVVEVLHALELYKETLEPERRHLLARYRVQDVGFRVVGTGSVGLRAFCVYLEGNGEQDPLFLQVKQEVASAWAPYLDAPGLAAGRRGEGERVVEGQRAMQVQSDPFLGHTTVSGRDFLVRQLNDHKGSIDLQTVDAATLTHYADLCGELLARGHARSGDPDALSAYVGRGSRFDEAIAAFSKRYADQTEQDWQQLRRSSAGTAVNAARRGTKRKAER